MCFTYKLFYNSNISTYIMDRLQIFIPNFFHVIYVYFTIAKLRFQIF